MSEMVERVADRLHEEAKRRAALLPGGDYEYIALNQFSLLDIARVAIEAMREPTLEMELAGDDAILARLNDHTGVLKEPTTAVMCHHAMIDAALRSPE